MRIRPIFLALALALPSVTACDFFTTQTQPPGPSAEELRAQEQAEEQAREQAIQAEIDDYHQRCAAAALVFESNKTYQGYHDYAAVERTVSDLSEAARTRIDLKAEFEVITVGPGKELLDAAVADWAKPKLRTLELRKQLKDFYSARFLIFTTSESTPGDWASEANHLLALGSSSDEWAIGRTVGRVDLETLQSVRRMEGTEGVHRVCRAALDLAIADDKRAMDPQHYVMQICTDLAWSDWEADLASWTSEKETKAFRKEYPAHRAELEAQWDAEAERRSQEMAEARARREAERNDSSSSWSDSPSSGGSSGSSGSSTSAGPVSVTLRNTCSSGIHLFLGDDPQFGSGRTDSLGSNSRTTMQLKVGQTVWLTDDKKNGLASARVSGSTRELEFSCDSVRAR